MMLTEKILLLTINATVRALKMHGGACVSALPGTATGLDRNRAQALLLSCAVTQLRLRQARAQATAHERAAPRAIHNHASTP